MTELIKSIKFKKVKNQSLDQRHKDMISSKKSKNVFIFADKIRNIYEADKNTYSKLLTDNISKTYKKQSITDTTRSIRKLKLLQLIMEFQKELTVLQNQAFISLIDHKPNFTFKSKMSFN